jgi:hypothetical protein
MSLSLRHRAPRVAGILLVVAGVLMLIVAIPTGLAAISAASDQCPDGNDCADARSSAEIASVLAIIGLGATVLGVCLRRLR